MRPASWQRTAARFVGEADCRRNAHAPGEQDVVKFEAMAAVARTHALARALGCVLGCVLGHAPQRTVACEQRRTRVEHAARGAAGQGSVPDRLRVATGNERKVAARWCGTARPSTSIGQAEQGFGQAEHNNTRCAPVHACAAMAGLSSVYAARILYDAVDSGDLTR